MTDTAKLHGVSVTIRGETGTRVGTADGLAGATEFTPGLYTATARWNDKYYTFESVDLTTARPDTVVFKPKEIQPVLVTYKGQVVHGITGGLIAGAIVIHTLMAREVNVSRLSPQEWSALRAVGPDADPCDPAFAPLQTLSTSPSPDAVTCVVTDQEGRFRISLDRSNMSLPSLSLVMAAQDFVPARLQLLGRLTPPLSAPLVTTDRFPEDAGGVVTLPPVKLFPAGTMRIHPVVTDAGANGRRQMVALQYRFAPDDTTGWLEDLNTSLVGAEQTAIRVQRVSLEANMNQALYVPAGVSLGLSMIDPSRTMNLPPRLLGTVRLSPGQVLDLGRVEFTTGVTIVLKIVDPDGKPVAGLPVTCYEETSGWPQPTSGPSDDFGVTTVTVASPSKGRIPVSALNPSTREQMEASIPYQVAGPADVGTEFTLQVSELLLTSLRSRPTVPVPGMTR